MSRTANGFKIVNQTQGQFTPVHEKNESIPNIDNPFRNSFIESADQKDINIIVGPAHQLSKFSADVPFDQPIDKQASHMPRTGNQKQRSICTSTTPNNANPTTLIQKGGKARLGNLHTPQHVQQTQSHSLNYQKPQGPHTNMPNSIEATGPGARQQQGLADKEIIFGVSQHTNLIGMAAMQSVTPNNLKSRTQKMDKVTGKYNNNHGSQGVGGAANNHKMNSSGHGAIINHHYSRSNPAPAFKNSKTKLMNIYKNGEKNISHNSKYQHIKAEINRYPMFLTSENSSLVKSPMSTLPTGAQGRGSVQQDNHGMMISNAAASNQEKVNPKKLLNPLSSGEKSPIQNGNINLNRVNIGSFKNKNNNKDTLPKLNKKEQMSLPSERDKSSMKLTQSSQCEANQLHAAKVNSQIIEQKTQQISIDSAGPCGNEIMNLPGGQEATANGGTKSNTVNVQSNEQSFEMVQHKAQDSIKPSPQVPNLKSNLTSQVSREYEGGGDGPNTMQHRKKGTELGNSQSIDRLRQSKLVFRNFQESPVTQHLGNGHFEKINLDTNMTKVPLKRASPAKIRTVAMSPEQLTYTPDFTLNANIEYQNNEGFITGEQMQQLQDESLIEKPQQLRKSAFLIPSTNLQDNLYPNMSPIKTRAKRSPYIFQESKRHFFQQTIDELAQLCIEKEAQYSETVSNLKQNLIDENIHIPGEKITEASFQPIEEPKIKSNGLPYRRKPTERTICENISAYTIYMRNLTFMVDQVYFPEDYQNNNNDNSALQQRQFSQDNPVYQKLCLPRVLITSYPSNAAMREIQHNDGIRKMLVQIKNQFKDHKYILTPVGISQHQRSHIDLQIYQMEYYNQSLIIKQQQQVYGVNRTDEAFLSMAKLPYKSPQEQLQPSKSLTSKRSTEVLQLLSSCSPHNHQEHSLQEKHAQMRIGSQKYIRQGSGKQNHAAGAGYIGSENISLVNGENGEGIDPSQPNLQSYLKVRKQRQIQNIRNAYTFNTGNGNQNSLKSKMIDAFQVHNQAGMMNQTQGPFYQKESLPTDQGHGKIQKFKVNQKQVVLEPLTLKKVNQAQSKGQDNQQSSVDDRGRWLKKTRKSFNIPLDQFEEHSPNNLDQGCITDNHKAQFIQNPFNLSDLNKESRKQSMQVSPKIEVREVEIGSDDFTSFDMEVMMHHKKSKKKKDKTTRPHDDTSETNDHLVEPHIQQHDSRNRIIKSYRNTSKSQNNLNKKNAKQSSDDVQQQTQVFSKSKLPSIQNEQRVNSRLSIGVHDQQQSDKHKLNESFQHSVIGNQEKGRSGHLPVLAQGQTMSQRSSNGRINSADQRSDAIQFIHQNSQKIFDGSQSPEQAVYQMMHPCEITSPMMSNSQIIRDQSRSERIFKKQHGTYNKSLKQLQKVTKTDRRFRESQDYQSQRKLQDDRKGSQAGSPLQKSGKKNKHHQLSQPPVHQIQDQPSILFAGPNQQSQKVGKKSRQQIISEQILMANNPVNSNQIMKHKITGLEAYKTKIKKLIEIEKECIRDLNMQGMDYQLFSPKRKSKTKNAPLKSQTLKNKNQPGATAPQGSVYNMYEPIKQQPQQAGHQGGNGSKKATAMKLTAPSKHLMNSLNFAGGGPCSNQSAERDMETELRKQQSLLTERKQIMKI